MKLKIASLIVVEEFVTVTKADEVDGKVSVVIDPIVIVALIPSTPSTPSIPLIPLIR